MDESLQNLKSGVPREEKGKLVLRMSTILIGLICVIMILPDDVFGLLPIYKSVTPSEISYRWLNYSFGVIQLVILLIGVLYTLKLNKKWLIGLLIVMIARELYYLVASENSIFRASAYEMYLTVFVGYAFVLWVEGSMSTLEDCESIFKWFLITNMLTLYINYAMGGTHGVGILAGRYHSSNLDVGGTGTVCVLCILYLACNKEKKWYDYMFIILSLVGLFLSGSRSNLAFLLLIIVFYVIANLFFRFHKEKNNAQRSKLFRRILLAFALLVLFVVGYVIYRDRIIDWILGGQFGALFSSQGLRADSSYLGRIASFEAGFDVLKHHPLGISGYFINLQQEIRMLGYPTFPHSTLLAMYLVFGPVVLIIDGIWIKSLKVLRRISLKYYLIVIYMLISTTIYGGPIANFKIVFIIAMVTFLVRRTISNAARAAEQ